MYPLLCQALHVLDVNQHVEGSVFPVLARGHVKESLLKGRPQWHSLGRSFTSFPMSGLTSRRCRLSDFVPPHVARMLDRLALGQDGIFERWRVWQNGAQLWQEPASFMPEERNSVPGLV